MEVKIPEEASFKDLYARVKELFTLEKFSLEKFSKDFDCWVTLDGTVIPPNLSKLKVVAIETSSGMKSK